MFSLEAVGIGVVLVALLWLMHKAEVPGFRFQREARVAREY